MKTNLNRRSVNHIQHFFSKHNLDTVINTVRCMNTRKWHRCRSKTTRAPPTTAGLFIQLEAANLIKTVDSSVAREFAARICESRRSERGWNAEGEIKRGGETE